VQIRRKSRKKRDIFTLNSDISIYLPATSDWFLLGHTHIWKNWVKKSPCTNFTLHITCILYTLLFLLSKPGVFLGGSPICVDLSIFIVFSPFFIFLFYFFLVLLVVFFFQTIIVLVFFPSKSSCFLFFLSLKLPLVPLLGKMVTDDKFTW